MSGENAPKRVTMRMKSATLLTHPFPKAIALLLRRFIVRNAQEPAVGFLSILIVNVVSFRKLSI
jgi:hypothetical protein